MPSPGPEQLTGQLHGVLEPIVAAAGFELDGLDVKTAGRRHTVKVVVDSDSGVGLDDIARLSRTASAELDQHEHLIGGSYTLEVTSPGVDRPLTRPRHWRRAKLRLVEVRTHDGTRFRGRVGAAGEESVTVLVDGALRELPYSDVAHATVQVEFNPPPEGEVRLLVPGSADPADQPTEDAEPSPPSSREQR
ncbi:ribosome maturation factor RimP [Pseudonocardia acidicola]|uniref:Ribosome maturation factor RimP n=1 Tax=Pseudonocardia acidicola TaxID=2724939 RepID=A0ABX1S3A0_9PSEU|nr:ribosome maturation factor RimP [Pseudonocardia acidicola]NMH96066.1 ribosome maturation factor RimP [Pseudonocardia acidicola]